MLSIVFTVIIALLPQQCWGIEKGVEYQSIVCTGDKRQDREIATLAHAYHSLLQDFGKLQLPAALLVEIIAPVMKDLSKIVNEYLDGDMESVELGVGFIKTFGSAYCNHNEKTPKTPYDASEFGRMLKQHSSEILPEQNGELAKIILDSVRDLVCKGYITHTPSTIGLRALTQKEIAELISTGDGVEPYTFVSPGPEEYFDARRWGVSTTYAGNDAMRRPLLDSQIIHGLEKLGLAGFDEWNGQKVRIVFPSSGTTIIPMDGLWADKNCEYRLVSALYVHAKDPKKTMSIAREYRPFVQEIDAKKKFSLEQILEMNQWKLIDGGEYNWQIQTHHLYELLTTGHTKPRSYGDPEVIETWTPTMLCYRKYVKSNLLDREEDLLKSLKIAHEVADDNFASARRNEHYYANQVKEYREELIGVRFDKNQLQAELDVMTEKHREASKLVRENVSLQATQKARIDTHENTIREKENIIRSLRTDYETLTATNATLTATNLRRKTRVRAVRRAFDTPVLRYLPHVLLYGLSTAWTLYVGHKFFTHQGSWQSYNPYVAVTAAAWLASSCITSAWNNAYKTLDSRTIKNLPSRR